MLTNTQVQQVKVVEDKTVNKVVDNKEQKGNEVKKDNGNSNTQKLIKPEWMNTVKVSLYDSESKSYIKTIDREVLNGDYKDLNIKIPEGFEVVKVGATDGNSHIKDIQFKDINSFAKQCINDRKSPNIIIVLKSKLVKPASHTITKVNILDSNGNIISHKEYNNDDLKSAKIDTSDFNNYNISKIVFKENGKDAREISINEIQDCNNKAVDDMHSCSFLIFTKPKVQEPKVQETKETKEETKETKVQETKVQEPKVQETKGVKANYSLNSKENKEHNKETNNKEHNKGTMMVANTKSSKNVIPMCSHLEDTGNSNKSFWNFLVNFFGTVSLLFRDLI